MEQTKKFYNQRAITIATYLGGPLAAGYLVKKNYETLEDSKSAKKSIIIGVIATVLLFAGIFSIPELFLAKIPKPLIPLIYTGIIYLIVESLMGGILKEHKESCGEFYSVWKAVVIGIIALMIILLSIAITAFMIGDLSNKKTDFNASIYDKELALFGENEKKALTVLNSGQTAKPDYLIKEMENGIELWNENKVIIANLDTIKNLPKELHNRNLKLIEYCDLRIESNKIIIKAISENTDKYKTEIEKVGFEINNILDELK